MDRATFLQSAATLGSAAGLTAADAQPAVAQAAPARPDRWANRRPVGEPQMKRYNEQRWILDNIIQANGIDWDQAHTGGMIRSCGLDIEGDMRTVRQRVKKYDDIVTAFESVARKREAAAKAAEASGNRIGARDNAYMAAQCYGQAMWSIHEHNDRLQQLNANKRTMFSKYIELADHHIEWVELPYRGTTIPAVFHLPPGYRAGERVPCVVLVPGMDGFKEKYVSLTADPLMERGFAALAIDGPGYWEAPVRGIFVDVRGWQETGKEAMRWLAARPEIDVGKVGIIGSSFGSFFSAIMMSDEPRYRCATVSGTCYEPGGETIFNRASVTFKKRFMFMAGIHDEAEFDEFRKTLDWHGYAEKVKAPYLVCAGSADQLCPMQYTEAFMAALGGPKQLLVYQDADHGLGGSPAATNGPAARPYMVEWTVARLGGTAMASERWYVDVSGKVTKTALQ